MKINFPALCFSFILFIQYSNAQTPQFGSRIDMGVIESGELKECSGIAASRKNKNVLWAHNDSGDENRIFALNNHGKDLGVFYIAGAANRDWEDIAVGPGPADGEDYIYIGDIGDNDSVFDSYFIYRMKEPEVDSNQNAVTDTIKADIIQFKYPDGRHDAETLMIDPAAKDIYIITKREPNVSIFRASFPQAGGIIPLEKITSLNLTLITAGDISSAGNEVIIKNYTNIYYWRKETGESFSQMFLRGPVELPYTFEPQGEGVCWSLNSDGYYTLSEEGEFKIKPHLYFYPRLNINSVEKDISSSSEFNLHQNYPNPFNPSTNIEYSLPSAGYIKLKIYNELGEEVSTLIDQVQQAGIHKINWQPENLASGIYYYSLQTGKRRIVNKLIYLK